MFAARGAVVNYKPGIVRDEFVEKTVAVFNIVVFGYACSAPVKSFIRALPLGERLEVVILPVKPYSVFLERVGNNAGYVVAGVVIREVDGVYLIALLNKPALALFAVFIYLYNIKITTLIFILFIVKL